MGKAMEERTWRKGEFWDESGRPNVTSQQQVHRMEDNRRMYDVWYKLYVQGKVFIFLRVRSWCTERFVWQSIDSSSLVKFKGSINSLSFSDYLEFNWLGQFCDYVFRGSCWCYIVLALLVCSVMSHCTCLFLNAIFEQINKTIFKLVVMVHRCLNGRAPQYLAVHCVPLSALSVTW